VTYNSAPVIEACLDALHRYAPEFAIIVVDNASTDGTMEKVRRFQNVCSISNKANIGFAAAVNQGVRLADGADVIMVLNPDVELTTSLAALTEACRTHGMAAGQLTDVAGQPQIGFTLRNLPTATALIFELFGLNRLWPSNPVNRRYRCLDRDLEKPGPVEQPAGAFLTIRRDVWERLGGMDEGFYPVWFEDVDFCHRAIDSGCRIEYVPSVKALHRGGHSVGTLSAGCRAIYWCDSLLTYAAKHFRPVQYRGVCVAVLLSSVPRGLAGIIRERNLALLHVSIRIARVAARRLLSHQTAGRGD
jgi:N-acetylglucosaminyl-diphospho-decaprenol L-rhamnosyltransferase